MDAFEFNFQHYLEVKRSVDDLALNRQVWNVLVNHTRRTAHLPLKLLEVGAGIGTMIQRAWEWGLVDNAIYTALDLDPANLFYAQSALVRWAHQNRTHLEKKAGRYHLQKGQRLFGWNSSPPTPLHPANPPSNAASLTASSPTR
ncbi:hypothetical protein QYE77_12600 [Thermanaerothrix sp. 4228-RoL]|uniref:Class I SAM-dependent methyltransferase n=1 Tax=Thermanaerothrix solaris TaxID=3058434 RepID=A0ABU3NQJ8_9CHLR|nr:hypothetical protein [Thermanaerothrix sp. 4228-RoL]MDT8899105.1 hypothetical protein [Thermanaerothrix sp. 4228-RoL]